MVDNSNRESVSAIAGDRREVLADAEPLLDGRVTLHCGDCLDVLATLPENSIDSVVCDPPYHLTSIVKRFGAENAAPAKAGKTGAYKRASAGFMGKQWDGGDVAFEPETWAAVYRVLKPGGHLLAFGAPKNFGFMQVAMAKAGFEIRDVLCWVFGSGFPKSHDVSKGIDRAAGVKGEFGERKPNVHSRGDHVLHEGWKRPWMDDPEAVNNSGREYLLGSDAARQWEGWGTALKPAHEPILVCRKPLSSEQFFAILLDAISGEIETWLRLNARDAPSSFHAIRATLREAASSVPAHVRTSALASIDPALFVAPGSISVALGSADQQKTQVDIAQLLARQPSSAALERDQQTASGEVANISIRITDICTSVMADGMSESIASSWPNISADLLKATNKFTTETASRLTIALRTLSYLLRPNIGDATGRFSPNLSPIVLARKPLSEGTAAGLPTSSMTARRKWSGRFLRT
jgi:hypothetical protein